MLIVIQAWPEASMAGVNWVREGHSAGGKR